MPPAPQFLHHRAQSRPSFGLLVPLQLSGLLLGVDVAGNRESVHQHIVEAIVVGVEEHYHQISPLEQRRVVLRAGLLDSQVVVLIVCSGQRGSQGTAGSHCFVGVGVDVLHVVHSCPFDVLLEFDGGSPLEGERVVTHIAVGHCAQDTISDFLAAHWVAVSAEDSGGDAGQQDELSCVHGVDTLNNTIRQKEMNPGRVFG